MGATHSSSWAEQDPGLAIIESSGQFLTCCHRHEDTRRRQNTIVARSKWDVEKEMLNGKQATQTQRVPSASKSTSMASLPRSNSQDYALESVDLGVGTPIERTSRASKSKSETVQTSVGTPIQRVPSASKWKSMAFLPRSKSEDALESFETDGGTPIERVPSQRIPSATRRNHRMKGRFAHWMKGRFAHFSDSQKSLDQSTEDPYDIEFERLATILTSKRPVFPDTHKIVYNGRCGF